MSPAQRAAIEDAIEALIALLDAEDGDCDQEPWLGAPERHPGPSFYCDPSATRSQAHWSQGVSDDREENHDAEDDPYHCVVTYVGDLDGTGSQLEVASFLNR